MVALCGETAWSCRLARKRAAVDHLIGDGLGGGGEQVRVNKARQLAAKTAQIADGKHRSPAQIPFYAEIHLVDLRILEVGIKENHSRRRNRAPVRAEESQKGMSERPGLSGLKEKVSWLPGIPVAVSALKIVELMTRP